VRTKATEFSFSGSSSSSSRISSNDGGVVVVEVVILIIVVEVVAVVVIVVAVVVVVVVGGGGVGGVFGGRNYVVVLKGRLRTGRSEVRFPAGKKFQYLNTVHTKFEFGFAFELYPDATKLLLAH